MLTLAHRWPEMAAALVMRFKDNGDSQVNTMRRACNAAGIKTGPLVRRSQMSQKLELQQRVEIGMAEHEYRLLIGQFPTLYAARQAVADALANYLGVARMTLCERGGAPPSRQKVTRSTSKNDASPDVPRFPRGYELRVGHITGRPYLARLS